MSNDLPAPGILTLPDTPAEPAEDTRPAKPKRPTTRAGRRAAAEARADKAPAKPKPTKRDVAGAIEQLHGMAGNLVLPILGMPATGQALVAAGPSAGEAWADAVRRYPQLEKLFGAGADGLVLFRLLMVYAPVIQAGIAERSAPRDPNAPDPMQTMFANMFTPAPETGESTE